MPESACAVSDNDQLHQSDIYITGLRGEDSSSSAVHAQRPSADPRIHPHHFAANRRVAKGRSAARLADCQNEEEEKKKRKKNQENVARVINRGSFFLGRKWHLQLLFTRFSANSTRPVLFSFPH